MGEDFRHRLKQACDDTTTVPEHGRGRQVAIARALGVSQEAVRKWFSGDSLPRPAKMRELAAFLDVDEPWLALGIKPELDRTQKRANLMDVTGAVHLIAGMIMMEGGHCAFPRSNDPRSQYVDLYAIIRGAQFAIHVAVAVESSPHVYQVTVPRSYDDVKTIAVVKLGGGRFHYLNMLQRIIDDHKIRRAGDYVVTVSRVDQKYLTGQDEWPKIKSFRDVND